MKGPIAQNIEWHIEQISLFIAEASQKNKKQRSRYYKAAFLFAASAIEAVVFIKIKAFFLSGNKIEHRVTYKYKKLHTLPTDLFKNVQGNVFICEEQEIPFLWKDDIDFKALNDIGLKYKLLNKRLYNKLEKIRTKRNRIHIQSLPEKDHKYTKQDIEHAGYVLLNSLKIL